MIGKSTHSYLDYGFKRPLNFSIASVHFKEGISKVITMLTPFISSLMGFLIAFLYTMRVTVSYGTSLCINIFGLHPPCFHPGVSGHHLPKACQYRRYAPSTHQKLFKQKPADDEEAVSLLVERENSLKVFPENLINDHASHEHVSAFGCEHNMIVLSDDAKDAKDVVQNSAPTLIEQVCGSVSEFNVFKPFEELFKTNARPTDVASHVSEVGLDSAKEIVVNKLDVHACTRPHSVQEMGLNLEVSAQKSEGMGYELDVYEMQKGMPCGLEGVSLNLKQKLSAQRQALHTVHVLLERQRTASSVAAQESMAMISMLQREKAALVLEAMQHQRMADEKEMFDENALMDLRDSLVKQEAELLTLEKEMELYRRKIVLKDQVATIEQKQVKSGLINTEGVVQQHSLLEYHGASRGTKIGQHANVSREQCRSSIHPSSSIPSGASTPNPDKEMRGLVDHAIRHWGSPDLRSRSMIVRDTSRVTLKKEASELLSRLQVIEADRALMRQTLELRRKERWELRLLQEVAGALKSLQSSSGKRTTIGMHRACSVSAVEAEIFCSKRPRCMEQ